MDKWASADKPFLEKLVDMGKTQAEIADIFSISQTTVSRKLRSLGIRAKRYWTSEEETKLKRLVSERKTTAQIAKILGRTKYAVNNRRVVLGIEAAVKLSAKNPMHLVEVIKFRMAGWTLSEIADVYGVDPAAVSDVLCQNGFKGRWWVRKKPTQKRKRWSEVELAIVRKYVLKGLSLEAIQLKLPHRSIAAIRKKRTEITRYWLTPEEQAERQCLNRKRLRLYDSTNNDQHKRRYSYELLSRMGRSSR